MAEAKKWSYNDIRIKLDNLKKIISPIFIECEIANGLKYTDDMTDAMNIAYYNLKRKYSKIKMGNFGIINVINYKPKQRKYYDYTNYNSIWNAVTSSSWTTNTYYAYY